MAAKSNEVRDFLVSRRANVTPEQVGITSFEGRRVPGLRREEVATLAGVSLDYYTRLERGHIHGASESVLGAIAVALRLNDAEREYLFDLARTSSPVGKRPSTGLTAAADKFALLSSWAATTAADPEVASESNLGAVHATSPTETSDTVEKK